MHLNDRSQLFSMLHEDAIVITPNNRLSNDLLGDFLKKSGQTTLAKPICLPYSAFIKQQYLLHTHREAYISQPVLLSPGQLHYLGKECLVSNDDNFKMLDALLDAWKRCQLWRVDFHHPQFAITPATTLFQRWALRLNEQLINLNAIAEVQLVNYLVENQAFQNPQTLILACFDDYTPQQIHLFDHLKQKGYTLSSYEPLVEKARCFQFEAPQEDEEYHGLIQWIKNALEAGKRQLGVIVPDLNVKRDKLKRFFLRHFPSNTFNFSLGEPLLAYPLVKHAFSFLKLTKARMTTYQGRLLLHSPYLAHSKQEFQKRSMLIEKSKLLRCSAFYFEEFLAEIKSDAPDLASVLDAFDPYPAKASIQTWVVLFLRRLQTLGFPGQYSLNSTVYQSYQRFLLLFDDFKQLGFFTEELCLQEALEALESLATQTIFQAKQSVEAPIQILGLLEAAGCLFEGTWVTGLTDRILPAETRPSAFIPLSLQRSLTMPHADPGRELLLAEKTLQRLRQSSTQTIFSYPRLTGEHVNRPSPLLTQLDFFQLPEVLLFQLPKQFDFYEESFHLPLKSQEMLRGGTSLLANQAKCPFKAFAAHRLHAKGIQKRLDGPTAIERGQLIHAVMENVWRALKSQEQLFRLTSEALESLVIGAVDKSLESITKHQRFLLPGVTEPIEKKRLFQIAMDWLNWERERSPFEIEALEETYTLSLAEQSFNVRLDRLDRLSTGEKWVIDYKSQFPTSMPWNDERPREPQLLLYALLDMDIRALVFVQLKSGHLAYKGLSAEQDEAIPTGIRALQKGQNWESTRHEWKARLEALAQEFTNGHCVPQPLRLDICQQCDYKQLCRFQTQMLAESEE